MKRNKLNKLTILMNLPEFSKGEIHYITRDNQKSYVLIYGELEPAPKYVTDKIFELMNNSSEITEEWFKLESSDIDDPREDLQNHPAFKDNNILLLTVDEACVLLGWDVIKRDELGRPIILSYDGNPDNIHYEGIIGVDKVYNEVDDKSIENANGFIRFSNSTIGMLDTKDYQIVNEREWFSQDYDPKLNDLIIEYRKLDKPDISLSDYVELNKVNKLDKDE